MKKRAKIDAGTYNILNQLGLSSQSAASMAIKSGELSLKTRCIGRERLFKIKVWCGLAKPKNNANGKLTGIDCQISNLKLRLSKLYANRRMVISKAAKDSFSDEKKRRIASLNKDA